MKNGASILIADDEPQNIKLLRAWLTPQGYQIIDAVDGDDAIDKVKQYAPDLILLDVMMPKKNGFEVCGILKNDKATVSIPIVIVTTLSDREDRIKGIESGADDLLIKPIDKSELTARVKSLLKVKAYNDNILFYEKKLEAEVEKRTGELRRALERIEVYSQETIQRLAMAAEFKDYETGVHVRRMSRYAASIAAGMGLDKKTVKAILYACPMHDVGKIGIPDSILQKPGKLDPEEWKKMQRHTVIGERILGNSEAEYIQLAGLIALTHHEKWDGSGYPAGLYGDKIPVPGQITAIADVFDALTSKRPYKEAFSIDRSFEIIKEGAGNHFSPFAASAFFKVEQEIRDIYEKYQEKKAESGKDE